MRRALRFVFALVLGLGLLTWAASVIVNGPRATGSRRMSSLRAQLAVSGARQALSRTGTRNSGPTCGTCSPRSRTTSASWRPPPARAISRCWRGRRTSRGSSAAPSSASTSACRRRTRKRVGPWKSVVPLPGGNVHVSAIPVLDGEQALGFVVLVHDLSYVERREAKTRNFLLLAFRLPRARRLRRHDHRGAALLARLEQRAPRFLRGGAPRPEFRPILRDVRELVDRIVAEKEADREGGAWTPAAAQAHAEPVPARRESRHRRQSRALHPRTHRGRRCHGLIPRAVSSPRSSPSCAPAPESGSPTAAAPRTARPRIRRGGSGCRRARSPTCSGGSGSRPKKRRATTTASRTRASGRSATSRTPGPSSAARTGSTTRPSTRSSRTRSARRSTRKTRSSSCRTITSPWCRA